MSFQEMYGLRGPWGPTAVLQFIYERRPNGPQKSNKNNNNCQIASSILGG